MDNLLVGSKLQPPLHAPSALPRGRLVDALERNIAHYKITQISAPAGYGKTTLLAQWDASTRYRVAWLSVDATDNDLVRFLRYLLAAWEKKDPAIHESPFGLLLSDLSPDSQAVLSAFLNAASNLSEPLVFVLDDYSLIQDLSIHQALAFLLEHLPPHLHFVLAGRSEPNLPMARYRARNELMEFRAENLQFSLEETAIYLAHTMQLTLRPDEIVTLQNRSEGWVAGIQLAALALQHHPSQLVPSQIRGSHRFIVDYLVQDVLAGLPLDSSQFLLETSILDRLSGHLCDAVTTRNNGQALLEKLEHDNLFLMPLDDERQWFRYHPLFRDFLRAELARRHPDQVSGLHRRAGEWYLGHDLPEQAFPHAVASNDVDFAIQILDRYTTVKLLCGEVKVVRQWLESLPGEWSPVHPLILFTHACVFIISGQFEEGVRLLDQVEEMVSAGSEDIHGVRAKVMAIRCIVACSRNELEPAQEFAQQALKDLPQDALDLRHGIYGSLGDTYRRNGQWDQAKACYLRALESPHGLAHKFAAVHGFGALADLELRQGKLHNTAAYWRKALDSINDRQVWGGVPLPLSGWVYIRLGEILYEWNEQPEASHYLSRGLERAELGGDVQTLIAGYVIAGRLELTAGNLVAATEYLDRARPLVENSSFPHWTGRFVRLQLELWFEQDRLRTALEWVDRLRGGTFPGHLESEMGQLAIARVLIAKGDTVSLEQALALLGPLLKAAEAEGRKGVQIEALALESCARWKRTEQAAAMTALEHALHLAEPEGYIRLFADLGLPMARLLQQARSRQVMLDYVEKLLLAFGDVGEASEPTSQHLPEPLSPRELQVLQGIAAGLTNREIAEQLVISAETVKKHTGTIYSKLGVQNRTQAARRAREWRLLD